MSKKKYGGYRSYSYLKEGEDYQAIPLAKEQGRVPSARVELTDAEEKRARAILDREMIVSLHDHTSVFPEDMGRVLEQRRQGRDATGYAGLAASDTDVFFENFMDGTATITSNKGWKWDFAAIAFEAVHTLSAIAARRTRRCRTSTGWRTPVRRCATPSAGW